MTSCPAGRLDVGTLPSACRLGLSVVRDLVEYSGIMTAMGAPVRKGTDPYRESDVSYLVVDGETMHPDIVEVDKGTPGSFRTLQEAKSAVMETLRARIEDGTQSLARIRSIGVD